MSCKRCLWSDICPEAYTEKAQYCGVQQTKEITGPKPIDYPTYSQQMANNTIKYILENK